MSLSWSAISRLQLPWSAEPDEIPDGVSRIGGMPVVPKNSSPLADAGLMGGARVSDGHVDPRDPDLHATQNELSRPALERHWGQPPKPDSKLWIVHHEDTGKKYLADGHHRVVVERGKRFPSHLPATVWSVSEARRGEGDAAGKGH